MQKPNTQTKLAIGFSALGHSPIVVAQYFVTTPSVVQYWKRKVLTGEILTKHGGYRWAKYTPDQKIVIQRLMYDFISAREGMATRPEIKEELQKNGFDVSTKYISRILHAWGWSFKVPTRVNVRKFTQENVEYYFNYFAWAKHQPIMTMKFCDESHFNGDSMFKFYFINFQNCVAKGPLPQ